MANQNDNYYDQLYNQSGGTLYQEPTSSDGGIFDIGDTFQGTINGAEEALRSTFGLVNYINPFSRQEGDKAEFDFIDEPDTIIGQLAGGFAQFAVGAALVTGAVTGGLAAISAFAAISAGTLANFGAAAGAVKALKTVMSGSVKAGQWYRTAKLGKGMALGPIKLSSRKAFEYAVQAPMIDFAAFHAESGRFVDMLEYNETLKDSVFTALSSDKDDPVLWARVKNVLDGAIAGGVTDTFFAGFKALGRKMNSEQVAKGIQGATSDAELDMRVRSEAVEATQAADEVRQSLYQLDDADDITLRGMTLTADVTDLKPGIIDQIDLWIEEYGKDGDFLDFMRLFDEKQSSKAADILFDMNPLDRARRGTTLHQNTTKFSDPQKLREIFKGEGANWEDIGIMNAPLHVTENQGTILGWALYSGLDNQAREVVERARHVRTKGRKGISVEDSSFGPEVTAKAADAPDMMGELDDILEGVDMANAPDQVDLPKVTEGPTADRLRELEGNPDDIVAYQASLLEHMDALSIDVDSLGGMEHLSRLKDDPAAIVRLALHAEKSYKWANLIQSNVLDALRQMDGLPVGEKAALRQRVYMAQKVNFQLLEVASDIFSNTGWSLNRAKNKMMGESSGMKNPLLRKFGKSAIDGKDIMGEYNSLMRLANTDPKANRKLELLEAHIKESIAYGQTPGERIEMIQKWSAPKGQREWLSHLVNVRTQNIIAGGKTLAIAAFSPAFIEPYKVARNVLGEVWMQTNPGAMVDVERLVAVAQRELYTAGKGAHYATQNAKGYMAAIKRSIANKDGKELQNFHSFMREEASKLRTGSRFAMDIGSTTRAQRTAMSESDDLVQKMLGHTLRAQHTLALSSTAIPAVDYAVQNGMARARVEANIMFKSLLGDNKLDIHSAKRLAKQQSDMIFTKTERLFNMYSADEVYKRTLSDPSVKSGESGFHQKLLENIESAGKESNDIANNLDDARIRAQGTVLNRDVKQMSLSTDELLQTKALDETKLVEPGVDIDFADPAQKAAVERRMADPAVADMIGNELVRKGVGVAADMASIIRKNNALRLWAPFLQVPINSAAVGLDVVVGGLFHNIGAGIDASGSRVKILPGATNFAKRLKAADPAIRMNAAVDGYIAATVVGSVGTLLTQPGVAIPTEQDPLPTVTGGGPVDPGMRKALQSAGWQPYSIKVGDKYISYSRVEPFASWLGIMADSIQISHYYDAMNEHKPASDAFDTVLVTSVAMLARQLTDKTFTRGLSDLFDILSGDTDAAKRWAREAAVSVAVPNSVRDASRILQGDDADLLQTRSMMDKLYAGIPGLSSQVKDKRRNILGEPLKREMIGDNALVDMVIPANATAVSDKKIEQEIARIPNMWKTAPTRFKGIDMLDENFRTKGRSLYDRWQEHMGEVTIRGKSLRQTLRILIQDPDYLAVPPGMDPQGNASPRAGMIEAAIRKYQTAALKDLAKNDSELAAALRESKRKAAIRRRARSGDGKTILDLLD